MKKYPNIAVYRNDKYNQNNISLSVQVNNLYQNAYVIDVYLYLVNKGIIRKKEYTSNYLGVYTRHIDDWIVLLNERGCERIYECIEKVYSKPSEKKLLLGCCLDRKSLSYYTKALICLW